MKRRPTSAPPSRRGRTARASACDAKIPQTVLASRRSASVGAGKEGAGLANKRMQMIQGKEVPKNVRSRKFFVVSESKHCAVSGSTVQVSAP